MALRVGLTPPWDLWDLEPDEQRERLGAIADAGIDHLFTADHVSFIDGSGLDGPVLLAALAHTHRGPRRGDVRVRAVTEQEKNQFEIA